MYYAQINDDSIVISVTQANGEIDNPSMIAMNSYDTSVLGKRYNADTGDFEDVEPAPNPAPVWEWYIDIGPFFDRFGAAKMAVLTSDDVGVQAIIKDTQVRKWLDLRLPEIEQSVQYIASKVPSLTTELQDQIVNTKPAEHENLALRKLYFSS